MSFKADATLYGPRSASFKANARIGRWFFADAVIAPTSFSFTASATKSGTRTRSFVAAAAIDRDWSILSVASGIDPAWGSWYSTYTNPNPAAGASLSIDWQTDPDYPAFEGGSFQWDAYQVNAVPAYADLSIDWRAAPVAGRELRVNWKVNDTATANLDIDWKVNDSVSVDLDTDWQTSAPTIGQANLRTSWAIVGQLPVQILYDGDTDITDGLIIDGTKFISRVNGAAGEAELRFRDDAHTQDFVVGKRLDLKVNGTYVWRGYIGRIRYEYPFKYGDVADPLTNPRILRIDGVDINVLFIRRVVFNQDDPLTGAKVYETSTPDYLVINELVNNWLDLSGDDIDTSTKVEPVGSLNLEEDAVGINPGQSWGENMKAISSLSGAMFYLNAERQLVYTDVETVDAPYVLSDQPDLVAGPDVGSGYREASHLVDASDLVNDFLAWGAGNGSASMVFQRVTDDDSIALHDRWQAGRVYGSVWKQSTIDRVADTVVHGSPLSHRGLYEDKVSVTCSTYTPGFEPGQVARFVSAVHGIDVNLPIREMQVTFEQAIPMTPKYTLKLSHERDAIFNLRDTLRYGTFPPYPIPEIPRPRIPGIPGYPGTILDSFSRATEWSYIDYETRETGLPGTGPDPATGWVSEGWQVGEEVEWTHAGDWGVGSPRRAIEPTWVDGSRGTMIAANPYVPQFWDGAYPTAETTIPNVSKPETGSQPIDRKNLTWKFGFERWERILPTQVTSAGQQINSVYADNGWWKNYDTSVSPTLVTQEFPTFAANFWTTSGGGFVYDNPLWKEQMAGWGPGVKDGGASWFLDIAGSGGAIRRIIQFGGTKPHDFAGNEDPLWWRACGGGMGNVYDRYAANCATYPSYFDNTYTATWKLGGGLTYFGGQKIKDFVFVGEDTSAFIWDQKMRVTFWSSIQGIVLDRSGGGPSGYALGDEAGATFAVSTYTGDANALVETSEFNFSPGTTYNFRWYRPNTSASYVKIWPDGAGEPTGWTASARPITGNDTLYPPTAVNGTNDTIGRGSAWGASTGDLLYYEVPYTDEPISGLESGRYYYIIPTGDPNQIRLADTPEDAYAGTYIDIDGSASTDLHTFSWNNFNPSGSVPQEFNIRCQKWSYQTYKVNFDHFGSITPGLVGRDDLLPPEATQPPPGAPHDEQDSGTTKSDRNTDYPYVPGTLLIWVNGTFQRPGIDYIEVNPATGAYRLLFTPHQADKITLYYVVAAS